jgi:plastocyanin
VRISDFLYAQGDLQHVGRRLRPPAVRQGRSITFINRDARKGVLHTITSCKAPCNKAAGISYPLANGRVRFDSGNLGFAARGTQDFSPASGRDRWKTPKDLAAGSYTYFCRVHPFMRGSFRIER